MKMRVSVQLAVVVSVLVWSLSLGTTGALGAWQVSYPFSYHEFMSVDMAVDSTGKAHVAYGDNNLYYAKETSKGWDIMVVDDADGAGFRPSIALTSSDLPAISYYDTNTDSLKYAYYSGTTWVKTTVDNSADVGTWNDLVMDSSNHPHIAYYDATNDDLKYAMYTSGVDFSISTLDSTGDVGSFCSITLDNGQNPHIAYYDATIDDLKYVHKLTGNWYTSTVDNTADRNVGQYTSIVLDGSNHPHISYYDSTILALKHAYHNGASWALEIVDGTGTYCGTYSQILLDGSGYPVIAYENGSTHIRIKAWDGDSWEYFSQIDTSNNVQRFGLARYGATLYLAYKYDHKHLRVSSKGAGSWVGENVDKHASAGDFACVATDTASHPHVCYNDGFYEDFRYAYFDGSTWSSQIIDSVMATGTDIVRDSAGHLHVCYYDSSNAIMKYAYFDGASWTTDEVETDSQVDYSSIAVGANNRPHMAYYEYSDEELRYAYFDGADWQVETVGAEYFGNYPSLALDGNGHPHISGYDYDDGDLGYIYYDGATWHYQAVDDPAVSDSTDVGYYTSLALDRSGRPLITYYDYDNSTLKYAWWNGSAWQTENIDENEAEGFAPLVLDRCGVPQVVYMDYSVSNKQLFRYAYRKDGAWQIQLAYAGDLEDDYLDNALALDRQGMLHTVFFSYPGRDLGYAVGEALSCGGSLSWMLNLLLDD